MVQENLARDMSGAAIELLGEGGKDFTRLAFGGLQQVMILRDHFPVAHVKDFDAGIGALLHHGDDVLVRISGRGNLLPLGTPFHRRDLIP